MYRLVCVAPHEYHLKKEPHQDFLNRPPTQNTPYIKSGENLLCIAKARCFVGGHEKETNPELHTAAVFPLLQPRSQQRSSPWQDGFSGGSRAEGCEGE